MRLPHVGGLDVDDREGFLGGLRPIGQTRPLAVALGFDQPDHAVRQVVLDIRYAEHVLPEKPGRFAVEAAAGDDEFDVVPGVAEAHQGEFLDPRDPRGLGAANTLHEQTGKELIRQLELLGCFRRQGAEERTAVRDEQHILTVDLRAHHRSQSAHGHRDVRKSHDLARFGVCCRCTESDGGQHATDEPARQPGHSVQQPAPLRSCVGCLARHVRHVRGTAS